MKIFLPLQSESVLICLKCFKGEKSLGGRIKATVRNCTNLRVVRAAMPSGRYFDNSEEIFCGNIVGSIRHCGFQLFKAG